MGIIFNKENMKNNGEKEIKIAEEAAVRLDNGVNFSARLFPRFNQEGEPTHTRNASSFLSRNTI